MKTIEIKNRFTNEVIFSHSCENNTIKITAEKAVEVRVNLEDANLDGASLERARLVGARLDGARLDGASLEGANLEDANLVGARLVGANLEDANLDGASLVGARLVGARLDGASLEGANLEGAKMPIFCKWSVSQINFDTIKIGCIQKTISEWDLFFASKKEFETKRGTKEFIQIQANYEAMKAYVNFINANKL